MSLNAAPSSERVHIGFYGRRNAGKSSLVNAVTSQDLSLVSDVLGTTTDPVYKAMELLPLGPVVIIDTPGIDDEGALGELRVSRSFAALNRTNIAILVKDQEELTKEEQQLIGRFNEKKIPYLIVYNKADQLNEEQKMRLSAEEHAMVVSAITGEGVHALKERIASLAGTQEKKQELIADLILPGETVILVVPIDKSAPKGRLILPQQQVIRALLDIGANAYVCREDRLAGVLEELKEKPTLVITDSQVFAEVAQVVSDDILLTSFSILFARYKGDLFTLRAGCETLLSLQDGDRVLIAEGCTHHRQCEDIGTVKIPRWIREHIGARVTFDFYSGHDFPEEINDYRLIIHCGGCMLGESEMKARIRTAGEKAVPITNYGLAIAAMKGILQRSVAAIEVLAERRH